MRTLFLSLAMVALPVTAIAGTSLVDTKALPSQQAHDVVQLTPLARAASGATAVALLDIGAGTVVPPHASTGAVRLLTVLSGEMSWGEGSTIDETLETVYPAGSILAIAAGSDHWLAARSGDVRLQMIVLDDETPVPGILEQMQ